MDGDSTRTPTREQLICVVWSPAGSALPASVAQALHGKGLHIVTCGSALVALSVLAREVRARRMIGDETTRPVLLLHEPLELDDAADALDVLDRYMPAVPRWVCTSGDRVNLRQLVPSDITPEPAAAAAEPPARSEPEPRVVVRPWKGTAQGPDLKLTGGDDVESRNDLADEPSENSDEPTTPRHILTEEELEMLLDEDTPGRGSNSR